MTGLAAFLLGMMLQQAPPAAFRVVAEGPISGIEAPRQAIVREAPAFAALWREHGAGVSPAVDFARETVVAIFLGSRPTAGYKIDLVSVEAMGSTLIVKVAERRPPPDGITAQVLTAPFMVVAVPGRPTDIRVERLD